MTEEKLRKDLDLFIRNRGLGQTLKLISDICFRRETFIDEIQPNNPTSLSGLWNQEGNKILDIARHNIKHNII